MTETPSERPEQTPGASDEHPAPGTPERPSHPRGPREREVTVRAAPSIVAFMAVGLVAGLVVALFSTLFGPTDQAYTAPAIFGILAVVFGTAGVLVGALVALLLDWRSRRRAQRFRAVRIEDERPGAERPSAPATPAPGAETGGSTARPADDVAPSPEQPGQDRGPEADGSR